MALYRRFRFFEEKKKLQKLYYVYQYYLLSNYRKKQSVSFFTIMKFIYYLIFIRQDCSRFGNIDLI